MSTAQLARPPKNAQEFGEWSFMHLVNHRDINESIFMQFGVTNDEFALHPFDPDRVAGLLDNHQQMHAQVNQQLGLPGNDLSSADFKNPKQLEAWVFLNHLEHYEINQALGI